MKHFKNITISIFTASLTILFVYGSYSTFASDSDEKDFENADYFWTAKYQYHNAMSDYFNVKFKAIYDAIEAEPNFFSANAKGRKYLTPPSETDINSCDQYISNCKDKADNDKDGKVDAADSNCVNPDTKKYDEFLNEDGSDENQLSCLLKKCGSENLSTYCVSLGALDLYYRYVDKLDKIKNELPETNDVDCFNRVGIPLVPASASVPSCANSSSLENLALYAKGRNEAIEAEYDSAKQVMEVTIAAYNEFVIAYPMHKRYDKLLDELIKYKKSLKWFAGATYYFPTKFIGTSSYSCS